MQLLGDAFAGVEPFTDLEKIATPVMAQVQALIIKADVRIQLRQEKEIPRRFDPKGSFRSERFLHGHVRPSKTL